MLCFSVHVIHWGVIHPRLTEYACISLWSSYDRSSNIIARNFIKCHVLVAKWTNIDIPKGQYCNRKDDLDTDTLSPLGCDTHPVDVIEFKNKLFAPHYSMRAMPCMHALVINTQPIDPLLLLFRFTWVTRLRYSWTCCKPCCLRSRCSYKLCQINNN